MARVPPRHRRLGLVSIRAKDILTSFSRVEGNSLHENTNVGPTLSSGSSGYAGNVLAGNNGGGAQVAGSGADIGGNLCDGGSC